MVALTRAFETQLLEGGPVVGGDMRMQLLPIRSTVRLGACTHAGLRRAGLCCVGWHWCFAKACRGQCMPSTPVHN